GRVDEPDVTLRIHTHRVGATGCAPRRAVHRRVMRPIGGPVSLGNGRHFSLAEQSIARRADESAAFLELENGVRAAVEYQNAASRSHSHGRDLDEIPGAGDSGSA